MRLPPTNHRYVRSTTVAGLHVRASLGLVVPTSSVPLMTGSLRLATCLGAGGGGGGGVVTGAVTAASGPTCAAALPRPATEPVTVTVMVLPTSAAAGV